MGNAFFLFRKAKEPKKNRFCLSPDWLLFIRFFGLRLSLYERRRAITDLSCFLAQSQRRLLYSIPLLITRFVI